LSLEKAVILEGREGGREEGRVDCGGGFILWLLKEQTGSVPASYSYSSLKKAVMLEGGREGGREGGQEDE